MPIPFTCPHCGVTMTVADQYAGQSGPCARCGGAITIPRPSGSAAPAPARGAIGQAASNCPYCGAEMQWGAILGDRYALKWQPAEQPKLLGIWSTGHSIGEKGLLSRASASGFRCAQCQKIIVEG
jgi:Zn-finger nucleic acid-binding protein